MKAQTIIPWIIIFFVMAGSMSLLWLQVNPKLEQLNEILALNRDQIRSISSSIKSNKESSSLLKMGAPILPYTSGKYASEGTLVDYYIVADTTEVGAFIVSLLIKKKSSLLSYVYDTTIHFQVNRRGYIYYDGPHQEKVRAFARIKKCKCNL